MICVTWVNIVYKWTLFHVFHFFIDHISKRISCIKNVTECILVIKLFTLVSGSLSVDVEAADDTVVANAKAAAAAAVALLRLLAIVSAS